MLLEFLLHLYASAAAVQNAAEMERFTLSLCLAHVQARKEVPSAIASPHAPMGMTCQAHPMSWLNNSRPSSASFPSSSILVRPRTWFANCIHNFQYHLIMDAEVQNSYIVCFGTSLCIINQLKYHICSLTVI